MRANCVDSNWPLHSRINSSHIASRLTVPTFIRSAPKFSNFAKIALPSDRTGDHIGSPLWVLILFCALCVPIALSTVEGCGESSYSDYFTIQLHVAAVVTFGF